MIYNENWIRWIKASIARHFKPCNTNFFVEGFQRNTDKLPEWVELRLDGPSCRQLSKNTWQFDVTINLLIVVNGGQNAYRMEEIQGEVSKPFTDCLEIFRLGEKEPDDQTQLGCMILQTAGRDKIDVTNYGKLKPDISQSQSSIEGHYIMLLDGE